MLSAKYFFVLQSISYKQDAKHPELWIKQIFGKLILFVDSFIVQNFMASKIFLKEMFISLIMVIYFQ